jgi:hypothetical protein
MKASHYEADCLLARWSHRLPRLVRHRETSAGSVTAGFVRWLELDDSPPLRHQRRYSTIEIAASRVPTASTRSITALGVVHTGECAGRAECPWVRFNQLCSRLRHYSDI